jgi:tetratricopeptide (TPR) repeat protein
MALPLAEKVTSRTEPVRRVARQVVANAAPHFVEARRSWAAWAKGSRTRAGSQSVERYQDELREAAGSNRRRETVRLSNLASAYRRRGELAEAQVCATRALAVARELGDERLLGLTLNGLGLIQARQPVVEPAIASFEEAREVFRRLGDRQIEGQVLVNLGSLYERAGDAEAARTLWAESLATLAPDSSAHEELAAWLATRPAPEPVEVDLAEAETAEGEHAPRSETQAS